MTWRPSPRDLDEKRSCRSIEWYSEGQERIIDVGASA
jgi:hypothetical protein